ncbi:hypothetical protein EKO29_05195 [Colwellia sp. Arc7-635]|uniref:ligand-binding sensor domain-containing protein n=1 Tax=Colwellia sp. Arc7-635 TaxID=2497879 RepID=UPI000F85B12C|nr:hypothetical protein [Colwellia sp. Arc7-635]AZQ83494.1 hypothetical protein EKO29_05195 [Colwellia sp. Arc7-635]
MMWCIIAPLFITTSGLFSSNASAKNFNSEFIHSGAIVQDNKGFIWLATTNGLVRYDSENNIVINSNNKDWPLPFNWINYIELIDDDKLLLATETHQLWLFDTTTGAASQLPITIHRNSVYQVIEHQGMYYLNVPNKLYKFDPVSLETQLISDDIDISYLQDTKDNIYIATEKTVFKLVDDKLLPIKTGKISAISAAGSSLLIAIDNKLIVLSDKNQSKHILVSNPIISLAHANDTQSAFAIDDTGNIEQYELTNLTTITHNYPSIEPTFIKKLYHDNTGVLWLLSNYGVNKIAPSMAKNIPKIFAVKFNAIALTVHEGHLILGSYGGGLGQLPQHKSFLPEHINEQLVGSAKVITDLYSYRDRIYIATFDGLWQFNADSNDVERVNFPNNNQLLLSMKYKDNALYLATNANGVIKFNLTSESIDYHIEGGKLSSSEVIDSLPLANSKLWVATPAGIDIVDIKTMSVNKIKRFGENKVIALLEYKDKVFVSTKGDGFFIFNLQGQLLSHFAKNITFGYMSFIQGEIWISGRPGLYRLNPDTYQLNMVPNTEQYTFTKKPVLLNNKVYVGHYGGVIEVPLAFENSLNAKIYISKTIASGKASLLSNIVNIDSSNDVVTFELASLDFRPGQEKQFKYKINGSNWNDINGAQLTLTGLSSGEYHIEIMGSNSLGQWSNFKAYADINVAYPWYWHPTSRVIYTLIVVASLLLSFWLLYLRSRSISHVHRLLEDEINTNSQSTSIIRRKLIKLQSIFPPEQRKQADTIISHSAYDNQVLKNAPLLIEECLAQLSTKNNHVAPSSLSGNSLTLALPYLADYFHQQYHVLVTVKLDIVEDKINHAIQTAIYRIIYEAIHAAITNDNGGIFTVSINEVNEKVWLKITDNEQSFAHFSSKINFDMAMYYIRQVANKFNATFHTYDNQGHGSEMIMSIPLRKI